MGARWLGSIDYLRERVKALLRGHKTPIGRTDVSRRRAKRRVGPTDAGLVAAFAASCGCAAQRADEA
jgi:hypothetical protein